MITNTDLQLKHFFDTTDVEALRKVVVPLTPRAGYVIIIGQSAERFIALHNNPDCQVRLDNFTRHRQGIKMGFVSHVLFTAHVPVNVLARIYPDQLPYAPK